MSLDYTIFLRDEPKLDDLVDEHDWLERLDDGEFVFAGFRISVYPYEPADDDPLADQPWRESIRWVVGASGRHGDDSYDDFETFLTDLGTRYRGAVYLDTADELRWYWWDRAELEACTRMWIADGALGELCDWLAGARGDAGGRELLGDLRDGPREQVEELALSLLDTIPASDAKHALVFGLWRDREAYDDASSARLGDFLLAIPAPDAEVAAAQAALVHERAVAADDAQPLPTTRDQLAALYDAAATDPSALRILQRGLSHSDGDAFMNAEYGAVLLDRARAGAAKPGWMWALTLWPQLATAPERATPATRAAFAARGSLAHTIAGEWQRSDAYISKVDDMLETRRRNGERFAGLPDDLHALAKAGHREEAIASYAKRYGLSLEQARSVVDANV